MKSRYIYSPCSRQLRIYENGDYTQGMVYDFSPCVKMTQLRTAFSLNLMISRYAAKEISEKEALLMIISGNDTIMSNAKDTKDIPDNE